jgi:hypothetical protein
MEGYNFEVKGPEQGCEMKQICDTEMDSRISCYTLVISG